jgi:glycosyltransferase involved in cell wall biosynthesis
MISFRDGAPATATASTGACDGARERPFELDCAPSKPLRVAFLMPHLDAGGAERVVLMLLQHLDRGRFAPVLILQARRGAFLEAVPADVPIHDLSGRAVHRSLPALAGVIRRTGAEVLYTATNAMNLAVLAASLVIRPRVAVVISEHAPLSNYLRQAKWRPFRLGLMRLLYRFAAAMAVPTRRVAEDARSLLGQVPVTVLSNPLVDVSLYQDAPGPPPEIRDVSGPLFVAAGRLVAVKAFDLLIESFARLRTRHPDAHLLLIGEGPERPRLEAIVESLGEREHVRLIGFRPRLDGYLRHATAFILTSHWEGFGNVLVEAMAAGAPVISVDCPVGPRDILEDGEAGLLVRQRNPEAIAWAMATMVEDRERRAQFQARGQSRARAFDVAIAVPAFEALFERVAPRRLRSAIAPQTAFLE